MIIAIKAMNFFLFIISSRYREHISPGQTTTHRGQVQLGPGRGAGQRPLQPRLHQRAADGAAGLRLRQVPRRARRVQAPDRGQRHGAVPGGLLGPRRAGGQAADPRPDDVQAAEDLRGVQRGRARHQPDDR